MDEGRAASNPNAIDESSKHNDPLMLNHSDSTTHGNYQISDQLVSSQTIFELKKFYNMY